MGLGCHRQEDDPEIWRKLRGQEAFTTSEINGLSGLFCATPDYLFSDKLKIVSGKSYAYWRWYDSNKMMQEEMRQFKEQEYITREMREKPYLAKLFRILTDFDEKQVRKVYSLLVGMTGGAAV